MPFAVIKEFPGVPAAGYDAVTQSMGLVNGGKGPAGSLGAWAVVDEKGTRVYTLFETEEAAQAETDLTMKVGGQVAEQLGVVMQPPTITVEEVHAYYTGNPS